MAPRRCRRQTNLQDLCHECRISGSADLLCGFEGIHRWSVEVFEFIGERRGSTRAGREDFIRSEIRRFPDGAMFAPKPFEIDAADAAFVEKTKGLCSYIVSTACN